MDSALYETAISRIDQIWSSKLQTLSKQVWYFTLFRKPYPHKRYSALYVDSIMKNSLFWTERILDDKKQSKCQERKSEKYGEQ